LVVFAVTFVYVLLRMVVALQVFGSSSLGDTAPVAAGKLEVAKHSMAELLLSEPAVPVEVTVKEPKVAVVQLLVVEMSRSFVIELTVLANLERRHAKGLVIVIQPEVMTRELSGM